MGDRGIREYGIKIGKMNTGKGNTITDVPGVKVGHLTVNNGNINTGVTAIIPHEGNIFKEKLQAACYVMNGFGKTIGTIQIDELGTIETHILLTNTLNVGIVSDALIEYMLKDNDDIGITTGTLNPVVCECNDGYLNDIRGRHITKEDVFECIKSASYTFKQGAVGAGTGMTCYGLKGGIGSSSRIVELDGREYVLGALVLSNFGAKKDLNINGFKAGRYIWEESFKEEGDKGSIIVIIGTNIPLSDRQLRRVSKRAGVGIIRTGSFMGNGSGDIIISFSTANKINHYEERDILDFKFINENNIDIVFRAAAEAVEESILNSLVFAETVVGRDGNIRESIDKYIDSIFQCIK